MIQNEQPLAEFERTGIDVDGIVSSQLLINIFEHNTPLHDGAVIVKDNRVSAATCYLEEKRFFRPSSSNALRSSGCNTTTIAIAAILNRFVTIQCVCERYGHSDR